MVNFQSAQHRDVSGVRTGWVRQTKKPLEDFVQRSTSITLTLKLARAGHKLFKEFGQVAQMGTVHCLELQSPTAAFNENGHGTEVIKVHDTLTKGRKFLEHLVQNRGRGKAVAAKPLKNERADVLTARDALRLKVCVHEGV